MTRGTSQVDFEAALQDPQAFFAEPQDVADYPELSRAEKLAILRRWEQDALRLSVSESEGMGGDEENSNCSPRPQQTIPCGEGCADPDAVGASGGSIEADRRAHPAGQDAGQFQPAALEGPEAQPGGQDGAERTARRQYRTQGRRAGTDRRPGRNGDRPPGALPLLPVGAGRRRSDARRPLRQNRLTE